MASDYIKAEQSRLEDILFRWNEEFAVAVEDQAQLSASRFLTRAGQKFTLTAEGYLISSIQVASAVITKMIDDGFLTMTEKANASDEEYQKRKDEANPAVAPVTSLRPTNLPGQYM